MSVSLPWFWFIILFFLKASMLKLACKSQKNATLLKISIEILSDFSYPHVAIVWCQNQINRYIKKYKKCDLKILISINYLYPASTQALHHISNLNPSSQWRQRSKKCENYFFQKKIFLIASHALRFSISASLPITCSCCCATALQNNEQWWVLMCSVAQRLPPR